ncbi:MAG: NAD(P)/FAD-dependent oxidoreductase [Candidatus Heimdallarchaeaceae archaeon]
MKNKIHVQVALVGCGPACATAAIQLSRSGLDILVITKEIGGTIRNANLIENLLGFPQGIRGDQYINRVILQLEKNKIPIIFHEVESIEYIDDLFNISTENADISSEYLIIGTGTVPKKLDIKGEMEAFENHALFYEVYKAKESCYNKDIVIIGSGDVAYDYALNLKDTAKTTHILQRTEKTKSIPILQQRVKKSENILVEKNVLPEEIKILDKTTISAKVNGKVSQIETDIIIVAIGREPNISFFSELFKKKYENKSLEPSTLYFVGDVKKENYRQISVAMGDAMKVAMEIVKRVSVR